MRPWDSSGQQVFCWSLIINPTVWKCFRMQGIFVTFPSADNCFQAPSSMRACSKIMGFTCTHIGSRPLPHTCHHVILDPGPGTVMKPAGRAQRCQRGRTHPEKLISLINCDRARFMSGFCSSTHFPKKGKNDIWHTSDTNPWGSGPGVAGGLGHSGMVKSHPLHSDDTWLWVTPHTSLEFLSVLVWTCPGSAQVFIFLPWSSAGQSHEPGQASQTLSCYILLRILPRWIVGTAPFSGALDTQGSLSIMWCC